MGRKSDKEITGGFVHARADNKRTLALAAVGSQGKDIGGFELTAPLRSRRSMESNRRTRAHFRK
ncbi:MAG: hypothetical protein V4733_07075 [Verrucomicrobiota bacterium]